jgi:hypothetical protein
MHFDRMKRRDVLRLLGSAAVVWGVPGTLATTGDAGDRLSQYEVA